MLGSPAGPGAPSQRGLWSLAPAPVPPAAAFTADSFNKYGVYSLFQGGPSLGSALYSHASIGRFTSGQLQPATGSIFHTNHKDLFLSSNGYAFGNPTPPPGSPYSPVPVAQLELFTKGINSNIIIQQHDFPPSPKKAQIIEKRCEEKCCSLKSNSCNCQDDSPSKAKFGTGTIMGCSRTNPIEWSPVNIKKEPGGHPCQVAEISTSHSPIIKVEVSSPSQKHSIGDEIILGNSNHHSNGANIPVGIAVARQRLPPAPSHHLHQDMMTSAALPPTGLLTTVNAAAAQYKELARVSEIESTGMAAATTLGGAAGGTLLQCTDDRTTALATWSMGGAQSSALAPPTLWQYPAQMPMESMLPVPVPMPPVGFQIVRDPNSGGLLLLPTTTSIAPEPIQQAVVWPYQHSSVLLPPPPPLQLISSASSEYLSSSTTLHQHSQTHSTRLLAVTTDTKRKIPSLSIPSTTLIKIETDPVGNLDQSKAISTVASNQGTVFTDNVIPPLVTTHVIYQHPTNLMLHPPNETVCKSQATSPVSCLTPPPENLSMHEEQPPSAVIGVQDASNQTDSAMCSEDDNITQTITDVVNDVETKTTSGTEPEAERAPEPKDKREQVDNVVNVVPEVVEEPEEDVEKEQNEEEQQTIEEQQNVLKPDLSGLELLSNSIVEFENCRNNLKIEKPDKIKIKIEEKAVKNDEVLHGLAQMTLKDQKDTKQTDPSPPINVDEQLVGLDLLCALAEQRIMEETSEKRHSKDGSRSRSKKKEKRKSKRRHSDEPRRKKLKSSKRSEHRRSYETEQHPECLQNVDFILDSNSNKTGTCTCQDETLKSYKSPKSEEEAKKFIASKTHSMCCKGGDWPCMNAMELDMRMRLADLQRQYREKQKELSRLKPKKHHQDCSKKRSRKKSSYSDRSTPPPLLSPEDSPIKVHRCDLLRPPTLCAFDNVRSLKSIKEEPLSPTKEEIVYEKRSEKRKMSSEDRDILHQKHDRKSASKKRKVGRPKRFLGSDSYEPTETIVAKKQKSSSFVGFLLAAKEKLHMERHSPSKTPPRFVDDMIIKTKRNKNNNNIITKEVSSACKIRPKLKAEATIKKYEEEEKADWESEVELTDVEEYEDNPKTENNNSSIEEEIPVKELERPTTPIEAEETVIVDQTIVKIEELPVEEKIPHVCNLTETHLEMDKLRVLTAMGGLFYAGHLNAVEPPDVYSITLDGERGNRPHIMSREEILRDAIVEVSPKNTEELVVGTRLCAYWSQQYRCLYPGSVAEPGTPNEELDSKFVSVEFDDGDSGRIAIEDIRLLPSDYPIMEYDPNPLLSLSKRKRRTSASISTEDRRHEDQKVEEFVSDIKRIKTEDAHKEKKKLKKKKKDKSKEKSVHDEKKRKKKHKCNDENCKHRKHHKKHRKHRKHHHDKESEESNSLEEKTESEESVVAINDSPANEPEEEAPEEEDEEVYEPERIEPEPVGNPEDEVTLDDIIEVKQKTKSKKIRDRQQSCESSKSKISAFLPTRQLWRWSGKGYKRLKAKGRIKKEFFKTIQRGKELITVGDSAVFLSTGRPDRPYIGHIEAMWEQCSTMVVRVKWFYHPEETVGCPLNLQYPGALFESPHVDENDVQTISHKCEVLPLKQYTQKLGSNPQNYAAIYDNNDIYYLAGYYDPTTTTIKMEPGIPFAKV